MALTEVTSADQTATLNTDHSIGSEQTDDAFYQLVVDANALANGETLKLWAELKNQSGGTARRIALGCWRNVQSDKMKLCPPIPNIHGIQFKLRQEGGTGRTFRYQILKIS